MICAIFECQHFVDNSQLQHFRFHFRSHSDFSTARTVKINIFVEINTMSLTNIAVIKEPTIRMPAKLSLTTIGLTTRAIKLSSVVNATCLAPQAFHDETYNNDMETWWLCTTTELHEAMKDVATEQIKGINGSTLMPSFDKVILSRSPTQAVTTAFYHYTEGHFTANNGQMILSSFTVNKGQQLVRLGNKSINLFRCPNYRWKLDQQSSSQQMNLPQLNIGFWNPTMTRASCPGLQQLCHGATDTYGHTTMSSQQASWWMTTAITGRPCYRPWSTQGQHVSTSCHNKNVSAFGRSSQMRPIISHYANFSWQEQRRLNVFVATLR